MTPSEGHEQDWGNNPAGVAPPFSHFQYDMESMLACWAVLCYAVKVLVLIAASLAIRASARWANHWNGFSQLTSGWLHDLDSNLCETMGQLLGAVPGRGSIFVEYKFPQFFQSVLRCSLVFLSFLSFVEGCFNDFDDFDWFRFVFQWFS